VRDGDGGEDRDAVGAADVERAVDEPGREPGLLLADGGERGDLGGDEGGAEPDADDQQPGQEVIRIRALGRDSREQQAADGDQRHAGDTYEPEPASRHDRPARNRRRRPT
jgi:hypothetical protein